MIINVRIDQTDRIFLEFGFYSWSVLFVFILAKLVVTTIFFVNALAFLKQTLHVIATLAIDTGVFLSVKIHWIWGLGIQL
jgi:hypothetical protein